MNPEVTLSKHRSSFVGYLNKQARLLIKSSEIVFDKKLMRIRVADFDDNNTSKLTPSKYISTDKKVNYYGTFFSFGMKDFDQQKVGKYSLEKEDDWFVLIKK